MLPAMPGTLPYSPWMNCVDEPADLCGKRRKALPAGSPGAEMSVKLYCGCYPVGIHSAGVIHTITVIQKLWAEQPTPDRLKAMLPHDSL